MKHSIKKQFAFIFIALMTGAIILCWFINTLFLGKYYIKEKGSVLISAFYNINELRSEEDMDQESFNIAFEKICSTDNLAVIIVDTSLETIQSSVRDEEILKGRLMDHIFRNDQEKVIVATDKYVMMTSKDPRVQMDYMELWGSLDSGEIIIMRTALESIRESVKISNRFLMYVGFIAVIACAFIIWGVTSKITKPILELADISEKMTHLDFEAKYTSGGNNEIAVLGAHINQLSETLEEKISELKTANNELLIDLEKKEQIDEMRKEFLSNVSHELKTPIALIQGYAEGLKEEINEDAESRDYYCEVIMDEANKMSKLVKNLLNLNQIECGNDKVTLERFDIAELIRNCIQSADILSKQNGIEVIFSEENPVYVWADEFKTEEVFMNYLSNAIHYASGEKKIEVRMHKEENNVRISVFNTGEPIPEDAIPQLWTKFYKVDKARTREYGGSGVGLSIVKAIMDSFNKEYGVINYANGVEFWFELDSK